MDDVRQFVVTGAAAPWEGEEGREQQWLGVTNACSLARSFLAMGIEVIVTDVLTPETCDLYRCGLPGCLIVHMTVGLPEAMRRAASRKVWLTDHEFRMLHDADAANPRTPTIASRGGHTRLGEPGREGGETLESKSMIRPRATVDVQDLCRLSRRVPNDSV
ncbi:hypothetical protein ABZX12_35190 [Kribbella sp. NPDC003505]|uniref:hypothetical protein n=1 Tax=Kribbella sp. NPDC003505 TaxID=3154448 RepID=UPI0033BBB29C